MTPRPHYAFRLLVRYPEGSVFDPERPEDLRWLSWEPEGWQPDWDPDPDADVDFRWPRVRLVFSRGAAERRASLLRSYGAEVEVVRSDRITFPGET